MAYTTVVPYADVTYANAYFADRLDSAAWTGAAANQLPALKQATVAIDKLPLVGEVCVEGQVREFPRDVDDCTVGGIPDDVSQACCEVAIAYLQGKTPQKVDKSVGRSSESVGDAAVAYEDGRGAAGAYDDFSGLPSRLAAQLMAPWMTDDSEIDLSRV